jgi:hypothetical protein
MGVLRTISVDVAVVHALWIADLAQMSEFAYSPAWDAGRFDVNARARH